MNLERENKKLASKIDEQADVIASLKGALSRNQETARDTIESLRDKVADLQEELANLYADYAMVTCEYESLWLSKRKRDD